MTNAEDVGERSVSKGGMRKRQIISAQIQIGVADGAFVIAF